MARTEARRRARTRAGPRPHPGGSACGEDAAPEGRPRPPVPVRTTPERRRLRGSRRIAADDGRHRRARLEFHLHHAAIAGQSEHLGQSGNGLAPDLEFAQLPAGELRDPPGPAGEAGQGGVVEDHGHPVASHLHVELDAISAQRQRAAESGQGILRRLGGGAAVGDEQRAGHGTEKNAETTGRRAYPLMGGCPKSPARTVRAVGCVTGIWPKQADVGRGGQPNPTTLGKSAGFGDPALLL